MFLGFGTLSDQGTDFRPLGGPFIAELPGGSRGSASRSEESGQGGLAFRWFLPNLGSGTELGLYLPKYASRLPLVSSPRGRARPASATPPAPRPRSRPRCRRWSGCAPPAPSTSAPPRACRRPGRRRRRSAPGTLASYATIGVNTSHRRHDGEHRRAANALAQHEYAETSQYFVEYPDDLRRSAPRSTRSSAPPASRLQGELTYRHNTPLQFDDVELLFASLGPLEQALFPLSAPGVPFPLTCNTAIPTATRCGQIPGNGPGGAIQGWGRYDVWQFQMTATKAFAQVLGAQQLILLGEAGVTDIPGLPSKTSGGPGQARGCSFDPGHERVGQRARSPAFSSARSSRGAASRRRCRGLRRPRQARVPEPRGSVEREPAGRLLAGRQRHEPGSRRQLRRGALSVQLGIGADLENRWELDVSYTQFGGAGHYNLLTDRDFVAATVKFSF